MMYSSSRPIIIKRNRGVDFVKIEDVSAQDADFLKRFGNLGEVEPGVFVLMVDFTRWSVMRVPGERKLIEFSGVVSK